MTRYIIIPAIIAAMASMSAAATGLRDADIPDEKISVALSSISDGYEANGGLTIKEKTHRHCGASSIHSMPQDLGASTGFSGGKGDRLAASECELNTPVD